MVLSTLPLLRLCATVPFPGTAPYVATVPEELDPAPTTVALAWRGAFDQEAPFIGVTASVLSLKDGVLRCEARERCTLTPTSATRDGLPLVDAQPLDDEASEAEACAALCEELRQSLRDIASVNEDLQLWPPLDGIDDPSAFSLALAGTVEMVPAAQQRWLESTSAERRLDDLNERLQATRSFHATQAALRQLGSMFGPGSDV